MARRRSWRFCSAALGAGIVLSLLFATDALATYPGADGRISFVRGSAIWTVNPDGSGVQQMTGPPTGIRHSDPAWSPDGQKLAMARFGATSADQGIFTVGANGSGLKRISQGTDAYWDVNPTWSPDGKRIAFSRVPDLPCDCGEIWTANADGSGKEVRLGPGPADFGGPVGQYPDWRPQGDVIAVGAYMDSPRLWDLKGGTPPPFPGFPEVGCWATNPSWAPDGSRIVFDAQFCQGTPDNGALGLGTATLDGSGPQIFAGPNADPEDNDPAWSPDGRSIVFTRGASLYVMNADGSNPHLLVADATQPSWQPLPPPNPLPTLSSITPAGVQAGRTTNLTLTVNGLGFQTSSVVRWNGESRPTTYVSSGRLSARISPADLATAGSAQVSVVTGPPGGGESATLGFTVAPSSPTSTAAPLVTSAPVISGVAQEGQTLTCSTGSWSGAPTGFSWSWLSDGSVVAGAAGPAYVPTVADVGSPLTCRVAASNAGGTSSALSASVVPVAAPPAVPPVPPVVAGRPSALTPVAHQPLRVIVSSALRTRRGAPLRVGVIFSDAQHQTPVALQQKVGSRWLTVSAKLVTGRSARFVVRLSRLGTQKLRVIYVDAGVRHSASAILVRVVRRSRGHA